MIRVKAPVAATGHTAAVQSAEEGVAFDIYQDSWSDAHMALPTLLGPNVPQLMG